MRCCAYKKRDWRSRQEWDTLNTLQEKDFEQYRSKLKRKAGIWMFEIRTDLAIEEQERLQEGKQEIQGVRIEKVKRAEERILTRVVVETEKGASLIGKPRGTYLTLETPEMEDEEKMESLAEEFAAMLQEKWLDIPLNADVLVVGLGNREITPDALGPLVVDHLQMTRHMFKEYGQYAFGKKKVRTVSGLVPGVMAQTGMESVEIIKGVVEQTKPGCVIVIDALAARSVSRLNRTIQMTDTGIFPGSGIGNHRKQIDRSSLGVPVVAIGIPTVVDAATMVSDTMNQLFQVLAQTDSFRKSSRTWKSLAEEEKEDIVRELLSPQLRTMFVTPKDIDDSIRRLATILAKGLNLAFHG